MKRFALLFSFVTALLFGATVSAQMMPSPGLNVNVYSHTVAPVTYGNGVKLAENELIRLVLCAVDDGSLVPTIDSEVPFVMDRCGNFLSREGFKGKIIIPEEAQWTIQGENAEFYSRVLTSDWKFRNISKCVATINSENFGFNTHVVAYLVFYNTSTNQIDSDGDGKVDTIGCPGQLDGIGMSVYLTEYRAICLGTLPIGSNFAPSMGPAQFDVLLFNSETMDKTTIADFEACRLSRLLSPEKCVIPNRSSAVAPVFPSNVAGITDPTAIQELLTPQVTSDNTVSDGILNLELPVAAKGLMRYTVYTTTDLSKPFGEWSLLDEVLKTSEAKKVLADKSGMSYTLIRVEDYTVPTIVLPKIGEKRFYRVVGE